MCEEEHYLPLRVQPSGDCYCHRTCKSLYSIDEADGNGGTRMFFCTFCDHARIEELPTGELLRHEYCRQHTNARTLC
jgi:hypothetical protein